MKLSDWIEAYKTEDDLNYYIPDYKISRLYEIEKEQDDKIKELEAKNGELDKKLEIAYKALEFYADRMNYTLDDYSGISGEMRSRVVLYGDSIEVNDVSSHAGRRATEALSKIKGEV